MRSGTRALGLACLLTTTLLVASCNESPGKTVVPQVNQTSFGEALRLLHEAHLRAQVDSFKPLPGGTGLEGASIRAQDPNPGSRVARESTVRG